MGNGQYEVSSYPLSSYVYRSCSVFVLDGKVADVAIANVHLDSLLLQLNRLAQKNWIPKFSICLNPVDIRKLTVLMEIT